MSLRTFIPALTLRGKFLLAFAAISALLTAAVLLTVRYRVEVRVRQQLSDDLAGSIESFRFQHAQRERMLERTAGLLAALPTLKALMTSGDPATIQDASSTFWELAGSQLFVLADRDGRLAAFHASSAQVPAETAETGLRAYLERHESTAWWYGGGRIFQVFFQPITLETPQGGYALGLLGVGYEVSDEVAAEVGRVAASSVAFGYDGRIVATTLPASARAEGAALMAAPAGREASREVRLGPEVFLASTVRLSTPTETPVTLTVLKSFDAATAFLASLNQWIIGIGAVAVLSGSILVFFVSTTITRPLETLVSGVRALERGDYAYPLDASGRDEVAALTTAFAAMRGQLQRTQHQLLEAERMATIGRMANTISHDLRHPLTAIQAYAEFLAERELSAAQRKDYLEEIRIAINRMLEEINSLLGFSHEREALSRVEARPADVMDRAIRTVKALPDYEYVTIQADGGEEPAFFDPAKLERALLNLLFNAAETVSPSTGKILLQATRSADGLEIRVIDNGPGIPAAITDTLFEPFVSHGKQKGTGLGLTVVQNVMHQHGGRVTVEASGARGTTFLIRIPDRPAAS